MLYQVKDLNFDYRLGERRIRALSEVCVDIQRGCFTCLAGPSGSGKSTLLNVLGLIEPIQNGEITFDGMELHRLAERQKNSLRKTKLAFIFQSFHLFDVLTAQENVEYFLARQKLSTKEIKLRSEEALTAVGLWEYRTQRPLHMSGGQRQRVAIARAIAKKPTVIIADEPTASLDQNTGRTIMNLLRELNETMGVGIVLSSHDPMVVEYAHEVVHLIDGKILKIEHRGRRERYAV